MAIKTGRYGSVKWDPLGPPGTAAALIISLNAWKLDLKTDKEDVSCFGDTNKVYVPGLMDISGSVEGFWNSAELALFKGAVAPTPGFIELMPNSTESTFKFSGPAYLDASIDCSLEAPKVSGEVMAAGPWVIPGTP